MFKRSRELESGVFAVVELCRPREKRRGATRANIRFENFVWIVKKAQDEIEAGEVIGQFRRHLAVSREETGERSGFN